MFARSWKASSAGGTDVGSRSATDWLWEQAAVVSTVLVATTFGTSAVDVKVRMASVTTVYDGSGNIVMVGLKLNSGTVTVLVRAVWVITEVDVAVELTSGVKAVSMVKVAVTVLVCCLTIN